jgi:hypothetical protein
VFSENCQSAEHVARKLGMDFPGRFTSHVPRQSASDVFCSDEERKYCLSGRRESARIATCKEGRQELVIVGNP